MNTTSRFRRISVAALLIGAAAAMPALAHHSFAIFNMEQTRVFTGVVTRINPDANHLQIFFAPMNEDRKGVMRSEDGKPVVWAVEMAGSAQAATQGVSVSSFTLLGNLSCLTLIFGNHECVTCARNRLKAKNLNRS